MRLRRPPFLSPGLTLTGTDFDRKGFTEKYYYFCGKPISGI